MSEVDMVLARHEKIHKGGEATPPPPPHPGDITVLYPSSNIGCRPTLHQVIILDGELGDETYVTDGDAESTGCVLLGARDNIYHFDTPRLLNGPL